MVILGRYIDENVLAKASLIAQTHHVEKVIDKSYWESQGVKKHSPSPVILGFFLVFKLWVVPRFFFSFLVAPFFSKFHKEEEKGSCGQTQRVEAVKIYTLSYLDEKE